ncbi:YczE/YyaS/YitT family protein [Candidatus Enterococcus willemsii]|uniref:Integral membrane protein n=1 Tax=Candidatus Enterococcus willemsii TaxID=1857215 RepID=A0ABQ6YY98_9ENTE|nr:DUF6198 family protein [Enterococcus sp. CU12B]KAF1302443.1 hypothetical protein BAU17_09320 [Enterococcus sp. CU12B]
MTQRTISQSLFFYFISALGISMTIKAMIGVSSFNSLNTALADLTHLKIGTITSSINLIFLLICWFLDSNRNKTQYLLMLISLVCFGEVINAMLYLVFSQITVTSYPLQLFFFTLGTLIGGFGTGQVLRLNLLKFPIENFCVLVAERTRRSFSFYRYGIDFICVGLSLFFTYAFSLPLYVREGTLISLFLLSGAISWSQKLVFFPKSEKMMIDN